MAVKACITVLIGDGLLSTYLGAPSAMPAVSDGTGTGTGPRRLSTTAPWLSGVAGPPLAFHNVGCCMRP